MPPNWVNHATDHTHEKIVDYDTVLTPSSGGGAHPDLATHTGLGLSASHGHDYAATAHGDHGVAAHAAAADPHVAYALDADLANHEADATAVHGIANTTNLVLTNDARLSDARTPTAHKASHASGGSDVLTPGDVGAATSGHSHANDHVRQHSVTAALDHTFPGGSTFLRADGVFASPPGGSEAFPVGAVFLAVVSTNPATLLGYGTWSQIAAGRMLVGQDAGQAGFDTAEETGGASTHTHAAHTGVIDHTHVATVTDPGHVHDEYQNSATTGGLAGWGARDTSTNTPIITDYDTGSKVTGVTVANASPTGAVVSLTHDSPSHLPPYFVVYAWKRTA